jgi:hypothetical protein
LPHGVGNLDENGALFPLGKWANLLWDDPENKSVPFHLPFHLVPLFGEQISGMSLIERWQITVFIASTEGHFRRYPAEWKAENSSI